MKYMLYNPLSGHGKSHEIAQKFVNDKNLCKEVDITDSTAFQALISCLEANDEIYLFGGDGTLNRFVNAIEGAKIKNPIYYYPSGSGNDFCIDVGMDKAAEPFLINDYISNLPSVQVNGKTYKFINGVGFGIDGYCCEVGDELKEKRKTPNYTAIAIKGLLFGFKPVNAVVTVDGVKTEFKKVWIAPTMLGRHYGGGMIPTPNQDRFDEKHKISVMIFHGSSKLKTLMIFPSIFRGEHVKNTKHVTVMKGNDITVEFDRPTPLQIDGETVKNVIKYSAAAKITAKV